MPPRKSPENKDPTRDKTKDKTDPTADRGDAVRQDPHWHDPDPTEANADEDELFNDIPV